MIFFIVIAHVWTNLNIMFGPFPEPLSRSPNSQCSQGLLFLHSPWPTTTAAANNWLLWSVAPMGPTCAFHPNPDSENRDSFPKKLRTSGAKQSRRIISSIAWNSTYRPQNFRDVEADHPSHERDSQITIQNGRDTWTHTYTHCIRLHIHMLHTYTHTCVYIYIAYICHHHLGRGTTKQWAIYMYALYIYNIQYI